ncbi:hypothetical protein AXQ86_001106 [Salmonella enterica subsp. enterica serovar Braenderup]|nr:hypothetical protein [Salmonella enterica subsp. enterica serovar Braenderup]HBB6732341.1 hypothetical protein [Salmonella enterica]
MLQYNQHSNALFLGIDSDKPKTFVLEVHCCDVESALAAMETVIRELKLCQRQFGYQSEDGVKTEIRYS